MQNFLKHTLTLICIMGPSFYFGYIGKPTEMGLAIAAGALTVIFLNINKFQSFSAAGVQAELKKTVEEAYASIEQLKEVAKPLIWTSITNLTFQNRLGGIPEEDLKNYKQYVDNLINTLEINDSELNIALEKYNRYHIWDCLGHFIYMLLKDSTNTELRRELSMLIDYQNTNFPETNQIISICDKHNVEINDDAKLLLNEYSNLIK